MRSLFSLNIMILLFVSGLKSFSQDKDSLKYSISFNYYVDLSDTYGGGDLYSGEFELSRSWYGAILSYGHFQSQSDFVLKIPIEEIGNTLEIPFEEMSIMKQGSFSFLIIPIQEKKIETKILFGFALAKAEFLCFKGIDYTYSLTEGKFTYLCRDYQLVKNTHFGYQVGFIMSFYFSKNFGLQLNSKIQDLSNGGTFFFIGAGLCFRI